MILLFGKCHIPTFGTFLNGFRRYYPVIHALSKIILKPYETFLIYGFRFSFRHDIFGAFQGGRSRRCLHNI